MGINKTNLGTTVDSIKNFVKAIAGTHNSIPGRDVDDAHPISAITGLPNKMNIMDGISIAQKTVNSRGTKELIDSKITFTGTPPVTNGTSQATMFNIDVPLNDSIENYNILNLDICLDSDTNKYSAKGNIISTKNIVYNNTNTVMDNNNSIISIYFNVFTNSPSSYGYAHFVLRGWFKTPTLLHFDALGLPMANTVLNKISLISVLGINVQNVTIDPVEYVNSEKGIEDAPVGHILSQMGKVAPKHYLTCDGAVYNIVDYSYLSQYIKDQFGSFNFFGGDGVTTFAVPDLRNEFLRGYHGNKIEQLSGEIGVHQDGTEHINLQISPDSLLFMTGGNTTQVANKKTDKILTSDDKKGWTNPSRGTSWAGAGMHYYTARPTNTAVLYCIKYEPTYFMSIQGLIEESTLFEGDIGNNLDSNITNNIGLNDSIVNYDEIRVYFYSLNGTGKHRDCKIIPKDLLVYVIDASASQTTTFNTISCVFGYISSSAYTNINSRERGSTYTNLAVSQNQSHVTKVVGIKYKTFQS